MTPLPKPNPTDLKALHRAFAIKNQINLELPGFYAYQVLVSLELALQHPGLSKGELKPSVKTIYQIFLQALTTTYPTIATPNEMRQAKGAAATAIIQRNSQALQHGPANINLLISVQQAFYLVSMLQLTTRHPEIKDQYIATLTDIGQQLQQHLSSIDPILNKLLEYGWHQEYDLEALS